MPCRPRAAVGRTARLADAVGPRRRRRHRLRARGRRLACGRSVPRRLAGEALAYFERKYADLAGEVGLLEVRHRRGGASAADLALAARTLRDKLAGAAAVGDLAALDARVAALTETLAAASETEAAAAREAVDEAVAARTAARREGRGARRTRPARPCSGSRRRPR